MSIASIGSSSFDPSAFINRLAASAGQRNQSQSGTSPSASDMATSMARSVIETADTDNDGLLTVEESGQSEEVFNRFDTDDDGLLSEDELVVGMTDDITALQALYDSNATESLDTSALFNVSAAGVLAPTPPSGGGNRPMQADDRTLNLVKSVLDSADTNNDGYLTIEESGQSEEVFNRFDTDGDGLLSQEELVTGLEDDLSSLQSGESTSSLFDLSAAGVEMSPPLPPPGGSMDTTQMATDLASSILEAADADGDGYLTIEESGQSEEVFTRFDTDADGLLSQEELVAGLQADMESLASGVTDTSTLFDLSAAGVEMSPPPPPPGGPMNSTQMATSLASSILEAADADGDGYLTIEESGQSEEVFTRFDTDADGLLSQEELVAGLQADMESLASGVTDTSTLFDLSAAGLQAPSSSETDESNESPSATASTNRGLASGAGGGGSASGSSGLDKTTSTNVTVTDTPTATITTTTTTTTYTASDGTVTSSTTVSTSTQPKNTDLTTMLYRSLANSAAAYSAQTLDIQA